MDYLADLQPIQVGNQPLQPQSYTPVQTGNAKMNYHYMKEGPNSVV